MKHVLCIFAHPDDETFGPGGAIAVWSKQGITVDILCMTCGDAGGDPAQREEEIHAACSVLGVHEVTCLHYPDGQLGNNDLAQLEVEITSHILKLRPDTLVTFEFNGVSGHLDHIAVASATTQAFRKTEVADTLMYYTVPREVSRQYHDYFIYFPPGKERHEVDEIVDFTPEWPRLKEAMFRHNSQLHDGSKIVQIIESRPKETWFLVRTRQSLLE